MEKKTGREKMEEESEIMRGGGKEALEGVQIWRGSQKSRREKDRERGKRKR